MVCCLLCFSGEPVDGDEKSQRERKFQISLMDAPCKGQPCCILSCFCPVCASYSARTAVLDNDMSKYECCQGYISGCCCCRPGSMGEKSCPEVCLCLESCCCVGLSMSSSRLYVMDKHNLGFDPCDNRLIRLNNCLQIFACICTILAMFIPALRDCAQCLRLTADLVFWTLMGCMSAQIQYEVEYQKVNQGQGQAVGAPVVATPVK